MTPGSHAAVSRQRCPSFVGNHPGRSTSTRDHPLDTKVQTALMRSGPDPRVWRWLALLPPGRRRKALEAACERRLEEDRENRLPPFGSMTVLQAVVLAGARLLH